MGKTYRYSPEDEEFGEKDHRVSRREINKANREEGLAIVRSMPDVLMSASKITDYSFVDRDWVQPRSDSSTSHELYIRDQRLDLIQALGEQVLIETVET